MSVMYYETSRDLCHHGVKGMKWGVRRFQNKDGSLTSAGRKHYGDDVTKDTKNFPNVKKMNPRQADVYARSAASKTTKEERERYIRARKDMLDKDPEHYFPDFEYDKEPPKLNGKDEAYYLSKGFDEYKKYISSEEYKQYIKDSDAAYEKFIEPYAKESKAAEERYEDAFNELTTKYMNINGHSPYVDRTDSELSAIMGFRSEIENLYYNN